MQVRTGRLAAIKTTNGGVAARLEISPGTNPAGPSAAIAYGRSFTCVGSNERETTRIKNPALPGFVGCFVVPCHATKHQKWLDVKPTLSAASPIIYGLRT